MDSITILEALNLPAVLLNGKECPNVLHVTEAMRQLYDLPYTLTRKTDKQLVEFLLAQEPYRQIELDCKKLLVPERFANVFDLHRKANHDQLTGVLSRDGLEVRYQELRKKVGSKGYTVVMFFDADAFGQINKKFGHSVGDDLLKAIPKRLQGNIKSDDIVARFGGDEFLALAWVPDTEALHYFTNNRLPNIEERICRAAYATGDGKKVLPTSVSLGWFVHEGTLPDKWKDLVAKASELMLAEKAAKTARPAMRAG